MTQSEYQALCRKAAQLASEHPNRYRWTLRAYCWFGHVALIGLLVALVLLIFVLLRSSVYAPNAFVLLLKIALVGSLVSIFWLIVSALWVKIDYPVGYQLTSQEFPELFSEINKLKTAVNLRLEIHQVLLSDTYNASLIQTPRLGVLGWQYNTLTLGLPLLLGMGKDQAKAVIAHELGHLAGDDVAFASRIYRARIAWQRIMEAFSRGNSVGQRVLGRFYSWYVPRFSAYAFVLARHHEFEADLVAARLTTPEIAASALVSAHTQGDSIIQSYWQEIFRAADVNPQPRPNPWQNLAEYLRSIPCKELSDQLSLALALTSNFADTHPSLSQRLDNLQVSPSISPVVHTSAAKMWLGEHYDRVLAVFDAKWICEIEPTWSARFHYVSNARQSISQFEGRSSVELNNQELWQKVLLWSEFKLPDETVRLLNIFIKREPAHKKARFMRGSMLCRSLDKNALNDLEYLDGDKEYGVEASWLAYQLWLDLNDLVEAERWREKAQFLEADHRRMSEGRARMNWRERLAGSLPMLSAKDLPSQ